MKSVSREKQLAEIQTKARTLIKTARTELKISSITVVQARKISAKAKKDEASPKEVLKYYFGIVDDRLKEMPVSPDDKQRIEARVAPVVDFCLLCTINSKGQVLQDVGLKMLDLAEEIIIFYNNDTLLLSQLLQIYHHRAVSYLCYKVVDEKAIYSHLDQVLEFKVENGRIGLEKIDMINILCAQCFIVFDKLTDKTRFSGIICQLSDKMLDVFAKLPIEMFHGSLTRQGIFASVMDYQLAIMKNFSLNQSLVPLLPDLFEKLNVIAELDLFNLLPTIRNIDFFIKLNGIFGNVPELVDDENSGARILLKKLTIIAAKDGVTSAKAMLATSISSAVESVTKPAIVPVAKELEVKKSPVSEKISKKKAKKLRQKLNAKEKNSQ